MVMTDPIADLLVRLQNASRARHAVTNIPASKMKKSILSILESEGFIYGVEEVESKPVNTLKVTLKYDKQGQKVINQIVRISRPGRRVYVSGKEVRPVLNGRGIAIFSTNTGLLTDTQARKQNVGGELICQIW